MDDDIDIEEHDVMDNPRIKHIFPDIDFIKVEVEDIKEEVTIEEFEEDFHTYNISPIVFEEDIKYKSFNNKIIIGSKPSTSAFGIDETFSDVHDTDYQETCSPETLNQEAPSEGISIRETNILQSLLEQTQFQNKIILGSKTHTTEINKESEQIENVILDVSVVLEDCKVFLEGNPCFCDECQTLFPTDNDLDAHNMTAHSYLVAVSKNRAVKSTTKHSIHKNDIDYENLLCNHCNVVYPNTIALLRHTYELLPGKFECDKCDLVFENGAACKFHKAQHSKEGTKSTITNAQPEKYVVCTICTCHFKWMAKLRIHMKIVHYSKNDVSDLKFKHSDLKCLICNSGLCSSQQYNKHIKTCHLEYYHQQECDVETESKFRCPHCFLCFSSDYSVRIHLAAKHGQVGAVQNSKNLAHIKNEPVLSKELTKIPIFRDSETYPLPKSTLFRCNNCPVHFLSCASAVLHSRMCVTKRGDFKCRHCARTFKMQDKIYHYYQHNLTEKFTVIEVTKNILDRILCKCKTCKNCFDEKSFMTHHTDVCKTETPAIHCTECNLWIHSKAMDVHKKIHATGVTARDFIIINYVQAKLPINLHKDSVTHKGNFEIGSSKYKLKDTKAGSVKFNATQLAKSKRSVRSYAKYHEFAHFYCPTCKCYMKINKISDKHNVGQCNTTRATSTCKSCGLRFTQKSLQRHSNLHKKFPKLKLRDLKFTNIQTKRRINPPYPNFKKCKLCEVNFFSVLALKNHSCNAEEPKICAYCNKKFSDLAYNLHIQFHEYPTKNKINRKNDVQINDKVSENHINNKVTENENIPELIKKYRSLKQVWNILFLCKTCDIVIDTYDKVVEHCQDHFCNMQSYNITITHCNICDLNFVEECFKKHQELHRSDDFDKDSFKILEYKYENLLSDDWSEIFASLTKEQIDLILSKSIYKFTRCVRMKAVSNGPSNLTLYRCGKCNVIIAPNRVAEHSQNDRCEYSRKFTCLVCKLRFAYKSHKIIHESLHEFRKLNAKSFRIVEFNAENQFSVTELKHNEVAELNVGVGKQKKQPEGLKFIRCQHCGKLINKHKYKSHIKYHHYYDKTKANKKIVYNFYKCKQCNLCVSKSTVQRHICENNYRRKKCPKCPLWFRSQNLASHHKYHAKFSRNNMNIIYFENGEIIKKANKNLTAANKFYSKGLTNKNSTGKAFVGTNQFQNKILTYYQCSECTMCLWHKTNINRHACSSEANRITCEKCGITFISSKKLVHDKMHLIRNFNRKNIKLIQFTDKKIINSVSTNCIAQKRKPQSANETAAKKPRINRTFSKKKANNEDSEPQFKGTIAKKTRTSLDDDPITTCDSEDEIKDVSVEQSIRDSRCPLHNIFYKCNNCKILFVTGTGLVEHETVCERNRDFVKCNTCGFAFHASEIELHYKTQKCSNDMDVVYLVTLRQTGKSYKRGINWIYSCKQCDLYYMTFSSINYHFKRNHETKCALRSCEICNINFTSITYTKHLKMHHGKNETLISDLSIAEIVDTLLEVALKDVPGDNNGTSNTEEKTQDLAVSHCDMDSEDKVENSIEFSSNAKTNARRAIPVRKLGIYQCDKCGLNFVHPKSLERHKTTNKHAEVHYGCPICNLRFTRMSLKKHIAIHHGKVKKKVTNSKTDYNDSVVESIHKMFYDNKPNTSKINNYENIDGVSHANDRSLERVSSNFEGNVEISKNRSKVDDVFANATINNKPNTTEETNRSGKSTPKPVDEVETISRNSGKLDNKPNTVKNEIDTSLNKNKLFKCSICDVYFLTANDCYEHTVSHVQLDTTEFIACKICDLQFCCEFLGRHMKSHREETFSVDDLIVVEYTPNDRGETKTDTYLAMDRLKTKLVSTTTHFDTEDDKSVCVDSTTENVN